MAKLPFSLLLALRYLRPKRTYVSVITLISIIGVMLGVTILVLVISVMSGFEREVKRQMLGLEAHIFAFESSQFIRPDERVVWQDVETKLAADPDVTMVVPFIMGQVLIESRQEEGSSRRVAPLMKAYPEDNKKLMDLLAGQITEGTATLEQFGEYPPTLISQALAEFWQLRPGDFITVFSPKNVDEILNKIQAAQESGADEGAVLEQVEELIQPQKLQVAGIFSEPYYNQQIIVPLFIGQELYSLDDSVHGLGIYTKDAFTAGQSNLAILNRSLPAGWGTQTWMERNAARFGAIRMERSMMYFFLFFLIIVAAFSISNTLITVTVQKRREIGVMKAIGARVWQIVGIFLLQGMVVGFIGTLVGLGLGCLLVQFRNPVRAWIGDTFGFEPFPKSIYGLAEIPAEFIASDIATICIGSFIICTLAALPPAWFVARLDPARALRTQ